MKCIRKDEAIKQKSLKSLLLEKDILVNIKHNFLVSMSYVF